jgi:hypothetical protein
VRNNPLAKDGESENDTGKNLPFCQRSSRELAFNTDSKIMRRAFRADNFLLKFDGGDIYVSGMALRGVTLVLGLHEDRVQIREGYEPMIVSTACSLVILPSA